MFSLGKAIAQLKDYKSLYFFFGKGYSIIKRLQELLFFYLSVIIKVSIKTAKHGTGRNEYAFYSTALLSRW